MSLGEFQLISRYLKNIGQSIGSKNKSRPLCDEDSHLEDAGADPYLDIGIGDDAAVISALGNNRLAVSTDTLVESIHFPKQANPELIARRALRVNLSDMAAMAAQPKWFTLALTLPEVNEAWLEAFSSGLHQDAKEFGCQLIGGDTTKGPLNIGVQIIGLIPEDKKSLTRSGAQPDDLLVVTGTLGEAGAALSFDLNGYNSGSETNRTDKPEQQFLERYWLPAPRTDFALKAGHLINAACDISDGLIADAGHLCEQSAVSAVVEVEKIPVSAELQNFDSSAKLNALTAGDDYELCMAVSKDQYTALKIIADRQSIKLTVVGVFNESTESVGVSVTDAQGQTMAINDMGYTHF